jgi:hypothetical protein
LCFAKRAFEPKVLWGSVLWAQGEPFVGDEELGDSQQHETRRILRHIDTISTSGSPPASAKGARTTATPEAEQTVVQATEEQQCLDQAMDVQESTAEYQCWWDERLNRGVRLGATGCTEPCCEMQDRSSLPNWLRPDRPAVCRSPRFFHERKGFCFLQSTTTPKGFCFLQSPQQGVYHWLRAVRVV